MDGNFTSKPNIVKNGHVLVCNRAYCAVIALYRDSH